MSRYRKKTIKSRFDKAMLATTLLCLLPMVIGLALYVQLPESIATHFNLRNEADGFSSKNFAVFGLPLLMALLNMFVHFMLNNDPKKANFSNHLTTLAKLFVPILSTVVIIMIFTFNLGYEMNIGRIITIMVSLFFIMVGVFLPQCKQNYSMGIRIPWTLNDPEIWDKTHRLAGFLWILGGILMFISAFLPETASQIVFWIIMAMIIIMPFFYAYILYRRTLPSS